MKRKLSFWDVQCTVKKFENRFSLIEKCNIPWNMSESLGELEMLWEHKPLDKCFFHSFFEFSQTFMSVSITGYKHGEHIFYFY